MSVSVEQKKSCVVRVFASFAMCPRSPQEQLAYELLAGMNAQVRVLGDPFERVEEDEFAIFANPVPLKKWSRHPDFAKSVRVARVFSTPRAPHLVVPSWAASARGFIAMNPFGAGQISETRIADAMRSTARLCTQRVRREKAHSTSTSRFAVAH